MASDVDSRKSTSGSGFDLRHGGLGKTTLARKVYRDRDVRHHFDSFGWASISQQFHLKGILQRIVSQLIPEKNEQLGQMIDEQLIKLLYEVQQKRKCLIVLDDIWSVDHWLRLSPAFPSTETGSRVVLTTWNKDVAALVGQNSLVHELNCINEEETWNLLEMKAIPRTYRAEFKVDAGMEKLGMEMVAGCGG
ncbi:putative disease resistance protein At1g50180 [Camellia sinensis]|uniref:putative disease resistance protein At1g50180 n=1 Tax=Camellia sinensis TaxID=4442 RepID=UPI0010369025|nr:putative disease resistance protein At1g50180 [Camellia sinensis]